VQNAIVNAEQAINRANLLTGLQAISKTPAAATGTLTGDVTPFLGEENEGKAIWRVTYPNSALALPSADAGYVDPYRRSFDVVLEASSSRLLFIFSVAQGVTDPNMRPMPSSGGATAQLSRAREVYTGYVADDPGINFLTALDRILSDGMGSPFQAKEIHAVYVMHSRRGSPRQSVWAVTLRGLPPLQAHGAGAAGVPVWQRNHMRNVVDAITGKVLFATNTPQPASE
jgi:hypothetical protein